MIDRCTTDLIAIGQLALAVVFRNVDNQFEHVLAEHIHDVQVALFVRPANCCRRDAVFIQEFSRSSRSVDVVTFDCQHMARFQQFSLALGGTGRNQYVLLRDSISDSDHGRKQCFVEVVADAAYFTCRAHIYAQYRVGLMQTGE